MKNLATPSWLISGINSQEIKDAIFDNPLYKDMVKKIKKWDDLIEKDLTLFPGSLRVLWELQM